MSTIDECISLLEKSCHLSTPCDKREILQKFNIFDAVLSYSLVSFPDPAIFDKVLLPHIQNPSYLERASKLEYSPQNVLNSYCKVPAENLRLFQVSTPISLVFVKGGCLMFIYSPTAVGHHSSFCLFKQSDEEYEITKKLFELIWDESTSYLESHFIIQ